LDYLGSSITPDWPNSIHANSRYIFLGDNLDGIYVYEWAKITASIGSNGSMAGSVSGFMLSQNYPNPFNPVTVISYQLAVNSFVTVRVYDLLGQEAAMLVNEEKSAGSYTVRWDAAHFASGVYFYRLQAGVFSVTRKLLLLK
jgi:hypothetical protein